MHNWSYNLQNHNKDQLRQLLLVKRQTVSPAERQAAAESALQLFINHPYFVSSQALACYFAQNAEFDCKPIINAIWKLKKACYLPILTAEKSLLFAEYQPNDELIPNRYNILEPVNQTILPAENLDLVFVPLVGFDLQGNRLGMGGGYYDRTFAFLQNKKMNKPYLIGLAYENQYVDEVPDESYDVPLDAVLTEKKLYTFPKDY